MTAHDFDPVHDGCRACGAMPGEDVTCEPYPPHQAVCACGAEGTSECVPPPGLGHDQHVQRLATLYTVGTLEAMIQYAITDGREEEWISRLRDAVAERERRAGTFIGGVVL